MIGNSIRDAAGLERAQHGLRHPKPAVPLILLGRCCTATAPASAGPDLMCNYTCYQLYIHPRMSTSGNTALSNRGSWGATGKSTREVRREQSPLPLPAPLWSGTFPKPYEISQHKHQNLKPLNSYPVLDPENPSKTQQTPVNLQP